MVAASSVHNMDATELAARRAVRTAPALRLHLGLRASVNNPSGVVALTGAIVAGQAAPPRRVPSARLGGY